MGVIIGSTRVGTAPCVEAPESPNIKVGMPYLNASTAAGYTGREQFVDVGYVRDISVTRTFYCRKADIAEAIAYLASLSGQAATFNTGGTGPDTATYSGEFILDGEVEAASHSPSLSTLSARYVAQMLDANYVYPAGLLIEKSGATGITIKVDGATAVELESTTAGDGTGFTIRAGATQYANDIAEQDPALAATMQILGTGTEADLYADPDALAARIGELQPVRLYRKIDLCINGETFQTAYAPRGYGNRVAELFPLYYGWLENETPSLTEPVTNPRDAGSNINRYAIGFSRRQWYPGRSNPYVAYWLPTYINAGDVVAYVPLAPDEWADDEPYLPEVYKTINTTPASLAALSTLPIPAGQHWVASPLIHSGGGVYKQWALVGYVWAITARPWWELLMWRNSRGTPLWIRWETSAERFALKAGEWDIADVDGENAITLLEYER